LLPKTPKPRAKLKNYKYIIINEDSCRERLH